MTAPNAPAKIFLWRQTLLFLRDQHSSWLKMAGLFALMNAGLLLAYRYITTRLSLAAYSLALSRNFQEAFQIWWNALTWPMIAVFLLCVFAKYVQFYFFGARFMTLKGIPCALSGKQFGHFFLKKGIVDLIVMALCALWVFVIFNLSIFLKLMLERASSIVVFGAVLCFVFFVLSTLLLFKVLGRLYVVPSLALYSSGDELKTSWYLAKGKIIRILGNALVLSMTFELLTYGTPRLGLPPQVETVLDSGLVALMAVVMSAFNVILLRQLQEEQAALP